MKTFPKHFAYGQFAPGFGAALGAISIAKEKDRCYFVIRPFEPFVPYRYTRGPKKHSRKTALLAFWLKGFIK